MVRSDGGVVWDKRNQNVFQDKDRKEVMDTIVVVRVRRAEGLMIYKCDLSSQESMGSTDGVLYGGLCDVRYPARAASHESNRFGASP